MKTFKPDPERPGLTAEPFVAGIDPGLRSWLVARKEARDAKNLGTAVFYPVCSSRYKLSRYWRDGFLSGVEQDPIGGSVSNQGMIADDEGKIASNDVLSDSIARVSLNDFQQMIVSQLASDEEILLTALEKRNAIFLELAIQADVEVNERTGPLRRTALHLVCLSGDLAKTKVLLGSEGVDVNAVDSRGSTPLHLSIQKPSVFHPLEIVSLLINHGGCKINVQDENGHTPLHLASILGCCDIIELLMSVGKRDTGRGGRGSRCNVNVLDRRGLLPFDHVRNVDQAMFCKLMERYCSSHQQDRMWAHVAARGFVVALMKVITPPCKLCKRPLTKCAVLKNSNYRLWMHVHHRLDKEFTENRILPAKLTSK